MLRRIAFIGLLFLLLFSIAPRTTAQNNNERPLVVTTTTIIADVARNIAGEHVEVISLMPPYADVHAFDPTPQEIIQLSEADVVLINGADLEETMIDIVYNAAAVEPTVVSNGITVLAYGIDRGAGNLGITPRRMLLADDAGNVHVLNVFSDEIIATYTLGDITGLYAEEGRHPRYGFALTDEAVHVIDSGFRMVAHFDHYDPYLVSPRLMDFRLTDALPSMMHVDSDLQVVASHESSQLTFFEDADISAEVPAVSTVPVMGADMAWVWDERLVTPIQAADGEQIGLQILDLTGAVLFTVEDCPLVSAGFVTASDSIAFDCTTHALTIEVQNDDSFITQRIAYPDDATVNTMIYHPEQNVLLGVAASEILVVDLQTYTTTSIVGADVVTLVPHPNDDEAVLALTRTGELRSINVVTGETTQSIRIEDMPRETESQPLLMASGDMVYIGLVGQEMLVEVYASAEELVITDNIDLGFSIRSMVAFGAVVDPHALDTTSQVTGRVLGAGVDCRIQGDAVHGPCDPHFWLDPNNVMVWADNITAALSEVDPTNADAYLANAAAYKLELAALDEEIEALVATVPLERRQLVTNHDFLGYFARRYGFEVVGVVLPGGSTLTEPSARELLELVEIIEDEGIESIIVEASNPNRISDRIATEVGIETILLYSGALGDPDGEVGTYIDLMRFNATAIANTLGE